MGISNANKQAICEKYRTYLEIIYTFGNKVMMMKQLHQYAELLGIARSFSAFYSSIIELVDAEILKKESFTAFGKKTQLHMLVMRKFGIRYIEKKHDSYSVASVPKAQGNERILISIFKNQYILNKIVPIIQRTSKEVTLVAINQKLERHHSTILYNKNQGLSFLLKMRDEAMLQDHLDMVSINQDIERMKVIKQKMEEGLRRGAEVSNGKGKGKSRVQPSSASEIDDVESIAEKNVGDLSKKERITNYTINTMLAFNAYIAQIRFDEGQIKIAVLIFDIHNRSNIYKIGTHIACMFHMFRHYFKSKLELTVGIVSIDKFASNHLKMQAESVVIDFVSKEKKGTRQSSLLKNWKIDETMQGQIKVHFVDYNITNEYLDGIKHANLVRC
ncbi:hypothetical protein HN020_02725 [Brevibacillus borstelensis]|uniref:hypothetical protein n=1 Tax=Brevibacillus borstelensis TaxID=45462 RepID=UPI00148F728F|nr:hypothetical protein [Brevibacillus borstelensis]NOU53717.1 hypothetical protein [Brevibacillus borstelensis]